MSGRILIVDDQDDVRLALRTVLSIDGWDTEEAASGEEAMARLKRSTDFDALVVDYKMPGLDGLEVTRLIRGAGFERPIIICSAYLDSEIERQASGVDAETVSKGDIDQLKESIRRQVPSRGAEQREYLGVQGKDERAVWVVTASPFLAVAGKWRGNRDVITRAFSFLWKPRKK